MRTVRKTFDQWGNLVSHEINGVLVKEAELQVKGIEWPIWAKALKHLSKPEDKGIGDVIARMIGEENSAAFKAWHLATFGKPCGCNGRQARWNRMYPLS